MTGLKARCEKLRNFNRLNVIALSRTDTRMQLAKMLSARDAKVIEKLSLLVL